MTLLSQQRKAIWCNYTFVLSALTTTLLFIVNLMGFLDTETGSALGCGQQWPLCQGGIMPTTWNLQSTIEFTHRIIVFFVGLLLVVTVVTVWRRYRAWLEIRVLTCVALGSVVVESLLGALGVLFADPPAALATHLGIAILAFTGSFLLTVVIGQIENGSEDSSVIGLRPMQVNRVFRTWAWVTLIYTYLAMYFGAYVANTGDGGLFRGWPFPTESYGAVHASLFVDIAHRTFALGLLLLIIRLNVLAYRMRFARPTIYIGSFTALVFVCLQAFSGAYLIFSHISAPAFLVHVSIVTCLFATICYLVMQMLPNHLPYSSENRTRIGNTASTHF